MLLEIMHEKVIRLLRNLALKKYFKSIEENRLVVKAIKLLAGTFN